MSIHHICRSSKGNKYFITTILVNVINDEWNTSNFGVIRNMIVSYDVTITVFWLYSYYVWLQYVLV